MPITPPNTPVRRHGPWKDNAEMMVDVDRLGYLSAPILDTTYGGGRFWTELAVSFLQDFVASDIAPFPDVNLVADFTNLPFADASFPTVVFDPPYRLNGTPDQAFDEGYGIHVPERWQDRMRLIAQGAAECARVASTYLLVKCQDQVCSGKVRYQTDMVTRFVGDMGFRKRDSFELDSYRKQKLPQQHARQDVSTLLVFERAPRPPSWYWFNS